MKLLMYGVNKETVMEEDTYKYFLNEENKNIQMNTIREFDGVEEIAILSDDFRNEYYLYVDELIFSHGEFLRYLSDYTDKSLQEIIIETYSKFNEDVLHHLFEISSGYLADPRGSFEDLAAVENSLKFAMASQTIDEILFKMFSKAIYLSYDLKLDETVKALNHSKISKYIYLLKERLTTIDKKNFLISGNDFELYYMTKLLLFAGARTISIIKKDEVETKEYFEKLKSRLNGAELSKIYPIDSKSLYFRLSKVDAIIIDSSKVDIFSKSIWDEVAVIRQTKKVQYLLDMNADDSKRIESSTLDLRLIDTSFEINYEDAELNEAVVAFEEKLSTHIKMFMDFLEEVQINNSEKILK